MVAFYNALIILLVITFCSGYPQRNITKNPEETAGYFEGDIILSDEQIMEMNSRNGLISRAKRWPDRLVIYKISPDFDSAHKTHILKAIKRIEADTCIRFKEADESSKYYINITAYPNGCYSTIGYQKSIQRMNLEIFPLNEGCFRMGSILHEFLHTLGFYHQQSASDRDQYITIVKENIEPGMEFNFVRQTTTENFGITYDYESVLHYSSMAFSKNGQKTIITRDPKASIGQRTGMSLKDIEKLSAMYLCPIQI